MSDLGRSPASYRGLVAHWRQHDASTPNRDLQNPPTQPGTSPARLAEQPRRQSPIVTDHRIRARTHQRWQATVTKRSGAPRPPPQAVRRAPTRRSAGFATQRSRCAAKRSPLRRVRQPPRIGRRDAQPWGPGRRSHAVWVRPRRCRLWAVDVVHRPTAASSQPVTGGHSFAGTAICSLRSAVVSAGGRTGEHVTVARAEAPSRTGGALR